MRIESNPLPYKIVPLSELDTAHKNDAFAVQHNIPTCIKNLCALTDKDVLLFVNHTKYPSRHVIYDPENPSTYKFNDTPQMSRATAERRIETIRNNTKRYTNIGTVILLGIIFIGLLIYWITHKRSENRLRSSLQPPQTSWNFVKWIKDLFGYTEPVFHVTI